jgi:ABC-type bacteriocin/lantibiotic exporter with double-glycine peptidase domain
MKLLLGFEKPISGTVFYDHKPLDDLDIASVRRKIGTVLQNGEIIQGTIFSNITITGNNLTIDDAWEAAEFAGIAEDIRRMPLQMNTRMPDGGRGISGGQKQRLLIARAIVNKPKILFFDEATSALDNLTQKAVTESLGALECTRVVIAHRLSTIQNCDRIFCLDKGKVIEEGTYDELMQKNGFFAELVSRQQV